MADDMAVTFSIGHLEGWIEKVGQIEGINNADGALAHLKIVEAAYNEYRRNISTLRNVIREMKGKLDASANI